MTHEAWLKLKNGTDIRGTAIACENEPVTLTDDVVYTLGRAFCAFVRERTGIVSPTVAVGHDSRLSADRLVRKTAEGITSAGGNVILTGLSSTPSMFMLLQDDFGADASVMVTASHLPYQKNGLKFFTPNGGLEGYEVEEILNLAFDIDYGCEKGEVKEYDFMSVYSEHLRNIIINAVNDGEKPLSGLKISVDSGNGAGGFYSKNVLEPLGADVSASQFSEPDGMFPNHIPNPENPEAMESAQKMVLESNSDFGVIFDTDVDRMGCVSSDGKEINRNRLVALASAIALQNNEGGTIVTDSLTSDGLREFIEKKLGGKQLRYKRGYKNVIDKALELNEDGVNCPLAIETSGHAALRENYFLDDGAYLAAKIISLAALLKKQGKDINSLISELKEPAESVEIRIPIKENDFKTYGQNVIDALALFAQENPAWEIEKENYEGIRVNFSGGWFLLRLSVHDPILPLNIECEEKGLSAKVASQIKAFAQKFEKLDLSNFDKVL